MRWVVGLHEIGEEERLSVGGKGYALARMARSGFRVPSALSITAEAYHEYVTATGLRERILLELHRKDFSDMRWEETWDAALRIRNMFLSNPLPENLHAHLHQALLDQFADRAVVVRSSSPEEDSSRASFAGLHESFVNVAGIDSILEHIRLVWASLWSDAALLYRQELGLDVHTSSMAVVVQQIVSGDRSGVVFSRNPNDPHLAVIECVYGLNQGLVDGTIEPDRWQIDRTTGRIFAHTPAQRDKLVSPGVVGVQVKELSEHLSSSAPLNDFELMKVFKLALQAEEFFGLPQDVEWTFEDGNLWVLQSRPITTTPAQGSGDNREWYLSLRRSFENLQLLRRKIERELIPAMIEEARVLAGQDLAGLSDEELLNEIRRRSEIESKWVSVYWEEFIPFAHGVRLFGQFYNDVVRPQDPYEFVKLLGATEMESLERNRMLVEMASAARGNKDLRKQLEEGELANADPGFLKRLDEFIRKFGDLSCPVTGVVACTQGPQALIRLVLEMASHPPSRGVIQFRDVEALTASFLQQFQGEELERAADLLDLARTSYRLRDNDNIHLARIEAQKLSAVEEGKRRIALRGRSDVYQPLVEEVSKLSQTMGPETKTSTPAQPTGGDFTLRPRQLIGQPAGPGISRGAARVILEPTDLGEFRHGEILVCDSVDPNMTFVVPLSAGIIERRGGMLIHGAIIAREYGLPCVTGIPDVTSLIGTGDLLTVDGYLGIVTIGSSQ
jgi:phosphohistidine swiveling domain-containing protein